MQERIPCVYLLTSQRNGTLHVGVTSNLPGRIWQHKNNQVDGFTRRYHAHMLVWYEVHGSMESAIMREKAIKEWKRKWKLDLIESMNPIRELLSVVGWLLTVVGANRLPVSPR